MLKQTSRLIFITLFPTLLFACGGGGSGGTPAADDGGGNNPPGAANTAPIANAGVDQTVPRTAGSVSLDASASSDADGDTLSFSWSFEKRPDGSTATLTDAETMFAEFVPDLPGSYRLQLIVSDGNESASAMLNITVTNSAPTADAGINQNVILGMGTVRLDGSASSDADSDPLTFSWVFSQTPDGSNPTLYGADTAFVSFVPDRAGTYRLQLTVSDGVDSDIVVADINAATNRRPSANAGTDIEVNRSMPVQLDGSRSSEPDDGQSLSYTWTQMVNQCPDVTGGVGTLSGVNPSFKAPAEVCTLVFDLSVNDGLDDSTADRVYVYVMEDKDNALFVDPINGQTYKPGTRNQPMLSIINAVNKAADAGQGADVYVSKGTQSISGLVLKQGVSLYGGFSRNDGWERDRSLYKTTLSQANPVHAAIYSRRVDNVTLDGFTIQAAPQNTNGNSVALFLSGSKNIRIANNIISAARAKDGVAGVAGRPGIPGRAGGQGKAGSCNGPGTRTGGQGGSGVYAGGSGGAGGKKGWNIGSWGLKGLGTGGGLGGEPGKSVRFPGFRYQGLAGGSGRGGSSGRNGANGVPAAQLGTFGASYIPTVAGNGLNGTHGRGGGGGGGGGQGGLTVLTRGAGNGGGGGGAGGFGGLKGTGGTSGYGSFGIYLYAMSNTEIVNNRINAGPGGTGGSGGKGGNAGAGGAGGAGGKVCTAEVGQGGNGGKGGNGGRGGNGGAGAGGPSIGIAYSNNAAAISISGNTITTSSPSRGGIGGRDGLSKDIHRY